MTTKLGQCPACGHHDTTSSHCPAPRCPWVTCGHCTATLDLQAGRGFIIDRARQRVLPIDLKGTKDT